MVFVVKRTCFYTIEETYLATWLTLDYICDLVFVLDMIVGFRTGKCASYLLFYLFLFCMSYRCRLLI